MLRMTEYIRDALAGREGGSFPGSILIWNLTRACNLTCKHCYAAASLPSPDELTDAQALELVPRLHEAGVRYAILSGGEPLMRENLFEIAAALRKRRILTSLSTNGLLVNEENLPRIAAHFNYVGISIDGDPATHDRFRGLEGSWQRSLDALRLCRDHGLRACSETLSEGDSRAPGEPVGIGRAAAWLEATWSEADGDRRSPPPKSARERVSRQALKVGLRFTITPQTLASLPSIFELAEREGFPKIYLSHLVYSGRGHALSDLDHETYRRTVDFVLAKAFDYVESNAGIDIVTGNNEADAVRLLQEFRKRYPDAAGSLEARLRRWGGNQAGARLVNIDYRGNVRPDPFFNQIAGNVKEQDFREIWRDAPLLRQLRSRTEHLHGRCAACPHLSYCNGNSRARAFSVNGDLFGDDPACYLPAHQTAEHSLAAGG